MKAVRRILQIAVFVVVLLSGWQFAHQNDALVQIDYVVGRTGEIAVWKALIAAAAAGAVFVAVFLGLSLLTARLQARRFRKAMVKLESEVHQLRNLPVVEPLAESVPAGSAGGTASPALGAAAETG